jgi:hypothetical protein
MFRKIKVSRKKTQKSIDKSKNNRKMDSENKTARGTR